MEEGTILIPKSSKETCFFKLKLQSSLSLLAQKQCDSPLTTDGLTSSSEESIPSEDLDIPSYQLHPQLTLESHSETSSLFTNSQLITNSFVGKVRVPTNEREKLYLKRAISFLANIDTGTSIESIQSVNSSPIQQTFLPPALYSSFDLNLNEDSITVPLTWITSDGTKKISYGHLLVPTSLSTPDPQYIQFDDYPPCLRAGPMKDLYNEQFHEKYSFIDPKLTLSKLMALREDFIIHICNLLQIEA